MVRTIYTKIARSMPALKTKLQQVGRKEKPEEFIEKSVNAALMFAGAIDIFLFLVFTKLGVGAFVFLLIFPLLFFMGLMYMMRTPDVMVTKIDKEISKEITFAGRFLVIELQSGVPLYDALKNIAKNYQTIGAYISVIIDKVDLGTPMEIALQESIEMTPSANFRKLLWQTLNSLRTGADISDALETVIDQIVREQMIDLKEYGRKLNPLAMFYMIIAVIMPSLGITMMIVLSSFINLQISLLVLIFLALFFGFVQFMFLAMIKQSRPPVEL